jgi:uncharacterized SAM-binding protein YcdF (DUF218 family)
VTDLLLSPLSWLLLGGLAALVLRRRGARFAAGAVALCAVVLMTPLGANALVRLVESRVPAGPCHAPADAPIVVLGAGVDHEPRDGTDIGVLSSASLRRLVAGVQLWERHPQARFFVLGASPFEVPESDLYANLAQHLGVPAASITRESTSTTTWENAQHLAALLSPRPIRLVTSALHAPRAALAFRAAGFEPCIATSGSDYLGSGEAGYFVPRTSALRKADAALHEIVGDIAYRWRARGARDAG